MRCSARACHGRGDVPTLLPSIYPSIYPSLIEPAVGSHVEIAADNVGAHWAWTSAAPLVPQKAMWTAASSHRIGGSAGTFAAV